MNFSWKRLGSFETAVGKGKNADFGLKDIENQQHDDDINKQLQFLGWTVIRFWGKDIMKKTDECIQVIEENIFEQKYNDYDIETEEISHV